MKEWATPDSRNTPSTTKLEEEEIVDALGHDGNASMQEQVSRPNPWMMTNHCMWTHDAAKILSQSKYLTLELQQYGPVTLQKVL